MSNDRTQSEAREAMQALARDPAAAAEWEEMRRIEDALDAPCPPEGLHAKIMGRVAADGPAPWMSRQSGDGRRDGRRIPVWALAAAILLVVAVVGFELQRSGNTPAPGPDALASITAAVPARLDFPARMVEAAGPARLQEEGRGMTRFAATVVQTAASPLRALPAQVEAQPGGDSSMIERERSS